MNLQNLKWTKNVKPKNGEPWAYQAFKVGNLFKLAWKDDEGNANKPQQGDLVLIRQGGYVTHLVEILITSQSVRNGKVISTSIELLKCFG
ncbi:hypothetical protein L1047_06860 [Synechococcus sp. Nb3U1]|uniref:hypothetical protein n=1 Tax=Synechococcus sp. Nb3U1 TaxID=1914529 RepID=UPI001F1D48D6|nr:hypothetical protein [Synechococcus sp. Nb3U1]MCF2970913.1 hypothetical protein [Synechococcus sp. Nb3U1]